MTAITPTALKVVRVADLGQEEVLTSAHNDNRQGLVHFINPTGFATLAQADSEVNIGLRDDEGVVIGIASTKPRTYLDNEGVTLLRDADIFLGEGVLDGLAVGAPIFLSATVPGGLDDAPPVDESHIPVQVGYVVAAWRESGYDKLMRVDTLRTADVLTWAGGGVATLLASMAPQGNDAGIWRDDTIGGYFAYLAYRMVDDLYIVLSLSTGSLAVGTGPPNIASIYVNRLYVTHDDDEGTKVGGGWSVVTNDAYYGGEVSRSNATGAYYEFTSQAGAKNIGMWGNGGPFSGMIKVDITGSSGAVIPNGIRVKTAQDWVDESALDSGALIANGGTLDPGDYLWDESGADSNEFEILSSGHPADTYTVRLTVTGYARIGNSNVTLFVAGYAYGGPTLGTLAGAFSMEQIVQCSDARVWEISYNHTPDGASGAAWIGHDGMAVIAEAPVITVDGVEQTLDDGTKFTGNDIRHTTRWSGRHPELGSTNTADIYMTFRMNATSGMWISHTLEWLTDGGVSGFPFMWALLTATFDRSSYLGAGQDQAYTESDDTGLIPQNAADLPDHAFSWDADGEMGMLMYIPDVATTLNNYIDADDPVVYGWDAVGRNKMYFTRCNGYSYSTNEQWDAECNYRFMYWSDGANAVLSQA